MLARSAAALATSALVVAAVLLAVNNSGAGPTPVSAGPCGDLTRLYGSSSEATLHTDTYYRELRLTKRANTSDYWNGWYIVRTVPNTMPTDVEPPKPLVTATLTEIEGDPNIVVQLTPNAQPQDNGSFHTNLNVHFKGPVGDGIYRYVITMTCHNEPATVPFNIYVNTCPAPAAAQALELQPAGASTTQPPDQCLITDPPSPVVSPAITEKDLKWADTDCDGSTAAKDALDILKQLAEGGATPTPQPGDCPLVGEKIYIGPIGTGIWGDWDCSDEVTPDDSLKWLKWFALLQELGLAPCPPAGVALKVGSYWVLPD